MKNIAKATVIVASLLLVGGSCYWLGYSQGFSDGGWRYVDAQKLMRALRPVESPK
jgi:hypothetical protein